MISVSKELLNGNEDALERLYKFRNDFIKFINFNKGISNDDAKDIFQESILVFYKKVLTTRVEILNEKTYLFEIGKNVASNFSRKNKVNTNIDDLKPLAGAEEDSYRFTDEQINVLAKCLELLGNPCKKLIQSYYYFKMSMKEIAEEMNYSSVDSAKTSKLKCKKRLDELFFKHQNQIN